MYGHATERNWRASYGLLARWPWARLRHDRGHHNEETIAQGLHGQWRPEPLFAFAQVVALGTMDHEKIVAYDCQIEASLGMFYKR